MGYLMEDLEKKLRNVERFLKKLDDESLLYAGNFTLHEIARRERKVKQEIKKKEEEDLICRLKQA
jgi:hypothetical protein